MRKILLILISVCTVLSLSACAKKRTPYIGENGNWWIGKKDLGVCASGIEGAAGVAGEKGNAGPQGEKGDTGATGPRGPEGAKGEPGEKGEKGDSGETGAPGIAPHIGANGNWWIGEVDTGVFVGAYAEECSDGLVFEFQTLKGRAGAVVIDYRGSDKAVVIPSVFSSVPVIGIEASAFSGNTEITSVRLSANTVYLAEGVFSGCEALSKIDFNGAPIEVIPKSAFANTALREILLPNGVKTVESLAFSSVMNTVVCIPSSVASVSDSFSDSAYLIFESDFLPQGLENIANGARDVRYTLGVEVSDVVYDESINAYFVMEGEGYSLLSCKADLEGVFVLPDFYERIPILRIREGALVCAPSVTDVVIGECVTRLDPAAVTAEGGLKTVYLPKALADFSASSLCAEVEFYLFGGDRVPIGFSAEKSFVNMEAGVVRSFADDGSEYLYVRHASAVSLLRFFGNESELEIPSVIDEKPVSTIKSGFFEGYYTSVIRIPETVHTVESHSFKFVSYNDTYYPCQIYFAVKDPMTASYARDFLLINPNDRTEKAVFFGGKPASEFGW